MPKQMATYSEGTTAPARPERKVSCDEHEDELLLKVKAGKEVERLVALPAWMDILEPAIKGKRDSLTRTLLTTKFESVSEFAAIQQGINSLDNLLSCVYEYIKDGKEAAETLKAKNGS